MQDYKTGIGFFRTGLSTYWDQFDGLLDNLSSYGDSIQSFLKSQGGVLTHDAGFVDSPEKAMDAAKYLRSSAVDIVFVYVATYSLSSTVLPVVKALGCPVVLLNIQPGPSIDYAGFNSIQDRGVKTGLWLEYCQACAIPEIATVLKEAGVKFDIISGHMQDTSTWTEIKAWVDAAKVCCGLKNSRLGLLGHYYCGMLDVYTDLKKIPSVFGTHVEILEMDELASIRESVSDEEIGAKVVEFNTCFTVNENCSEYELNRAARTSVALDNLVESHDLGCVAYYYNGMTGNGNEDIVTSLIPGNTLLIGRGVPVAGEYEVKNVIAMKILSLLGAGGSFSEFYAMDFNDDVILLGHDGPAHYLIADGKVELVPLSVYHGKPGNGLSIQMTVRANEVTLLSVCEGKEGMFLLVAEGETVPGEVLEIGNTNSRYRFSCGMRSFVEQWSKAGPSHHCAVGIGHLSDVLQKVAFILGIRMVKVE